MSDPDRDRSLRELGERLDAARHHRNRTTGGGSEQDKGGTPPSGLGFAFRMGVELVGALAVGVGIGLLLDNWLGTKPWFLVVFFFMGAAAGFLNVYRLARGYDSAVGFHKPPADEGRKPDGDG